MGKRKEPGWKVFSSRIYSISPPRIQEALISIRAAVRRALREGKAFERQYSMAIQREQWSPEELSRYQTEYLRKLLDYAKQYVPYYSDTLKDIGLDDDADPREVVRSFPVIDKHSVLNAGARLLSSQRRIGRVKGSTSGTTGTPVTIYQDLSAINRENAFVLRQFAWAGFKPGDRRASLRGEMIIPSDRTAGSYWRMNKAENTLMMSSYHLSEKTASQYLSALRQYQPRVIHTYPSSITYLARYLEAEDSRYESAAPLSIITSSETLSEHDRSLVEDRFACKVFDWYGSFERVAAIGTCERQTYHLLTDYSYTEFEPLSDGQSEIIGTGFNNFVMPLIRFRTGDSVELAPPDTICECGRAFPVVKNVLGRQDDYVKTPDGRRIGRLDHIFKGLSGIAEAQIVQEDLRSISILIVPFKDFDANTEQSLVRNANLRLGSEIDVTIEIVESIPRTSNGKFRSVVCRV